METTLKKTSLHYYKPRRRSQEKRCKPVDKVKEVSEVFLDKDSSNVDQRDSEIRRSLRQTRLKALMRSLPLPKRSRNQFQDRKSVV